MPTMGLFSAMPPVQPSNWAEPKSKMPPSEATKRYPLQTLAPPKP